MKKYIIALVFVLGIMPSFDGDFVKIITTNYAQALGNEWWEDKECEEIDEVLCLVCNECYDSYLYSSCPTCGTIVKCEKCGEEYLSTESHECSGSSGDGEGSGSGSDSGSSSSSDYEICKYCGKIHNLNIACHPFICPKCGYSIYTCGHYK